MSANIECGKDWNGWFVSNKWHGDTALASVAGNVVDGSRRGVLFLERKVERNSDRGDEAFPDPQSAN